MTAGAPETDSESVRSSATRRLYVEFEVHPSGSSCCPLGELDGEIMEVRQQPVGETCHTDVTLQPAECDCTDDDCRQVVHTTGEIEASCPCTVFSEHGCVPRITDISSECVVFETYLPDRELLTDLVTDLKSVVDGLSLKCLKRVERVDSVGSTNDQVTLDVSKLTQKQQEAATLAVASGYYSTPREVGLGDLAEELELSKSALSQRLNAVESKLATDAFAVGD